MLRLQTGSAISAIPSDCVEEACAHVQHLICDALEYAWGYELSDVLEELKRQAAVLWIVEKEGLIQGIVVTEILLYPKAKSLNIWLTAGKDLHEWKDCFASLEMYARHKGCDYIETTCRPGLEPVLKHLGLNIKRLAVAKRVDKGTH